MAPHRASGAPHHGAATSPLTVLHLDCSTAISIVSSGISWHGSTPSLPKGKTAQQKLSTCCRPEARGQTSVSAMERMNPATQYRSDALHSSRKLHQGACDLRQRKAGERGFEPATSRAQTAQLVTWDNHLRSCRGLVRLKHLFCSHNASRTTYLGKATYLY